MNIYVDSYFVNETNEKRIVLSSLALLVDSKIKCPMLFLLLFCMVIAHRSFIFSLQLICLQWILT